MVADEWHRVVKDAWSELLEDYKKGVVILRLEFDMERHFTKLCRKVARELGLQELVANQEVLFGRRVDLRLGPQDKPIVVQLKLYHDKADWKETSSMRNTVESDLNLAKGRSNVWVCVIDVIPSSTRATLPYILKWERLEIDNEVFQKEYAGINPRTSLRRERVQKTLLVQGLDLQTNMK